MFNHKLMEETPGAGDGAGAASAVVAVPVVAPVVAPATVASTPAEITSKWPDSWRTEMSGGDEKAMKQLERYATPTDIWKKASALEKRLSSGELKSNLPKDANEDQVKAWRAENGLPESPDKYDLTGIEVSETDKPIVNSFLGKAHAVNMSPDQVKAAIQWNRENVQLQQEARHEADKTVAMETTDNLRNEWGNDFRPNMTSIGSLLDTAGEGMKDKILQSRMPDGTPIGSSPEALKLFLGLAREINPAGTVIPGAGANQVSAIEDEITKYEGMMGDNTSAYWKGPTAEKSQSRYRDLITARDKIKTRAA